MDTKASDDNPSPQAPPTETILEIDPAKVQAFQQQLKDEQNLLRGTVAGAIAASIGTTIWAIITVLTDYQVGLMALGVGFLVGYAARFFGKGVDKIHGVIAAGLALLGCLAGNLLTGAILISQQEQVSLGDVLLILALSPAAVVEIMTAMFSPIDLLFYSLAAYEGYRFSFRRITQAEKEGLYRVRPRLE